MICIGAMKTGTNNLLTDNKKRGVSNVYRKYYTIF